MRFLTRPGCHLCDTARPLVVWAAKRTGATLIEVDIDADDELIVGYGLRIPVVLGPGDVVVAEGLITDRRALREAIRRLTRS